MFYVFFISLHVQSMIQKCCREQRLCREAVGLMVGVSHYIRQRGLPIVFNLEVQNLQRSVTGHL